MSVHALERFVRRGLLAATLGCALLCACDEVPTILPPPFGPVPNTPPRLFFPAGITVAPSGQLLVANGNWDYAFAGGTVVSLDPSYIDSFFTGPLPDPTDPTQPVPVDIPPAAFLGAAMIGNYAGPLVLDQTGLNAFTGSRDTSMLNAVTLDPVTGALSCLGGTGGSDTNCLAGFLDVGDDFNLLGPYGIAAGVSRLPGADADQQVMFVSPLIPHIDGSISDSIYTSATVAALLTGDPSQALWSGQVSNYTIANGIGGGPMIFDAQRRKLIIGGCYTRFTGQNVGQPSSGKCGTTVATNLIRFVGVDEGANPDVDSIDIATEIDSTDTEDLALGNFDPVTGIAQTLFAITRSPDLMVEIALPADPTALIQVTRATSMPIFPSHMIRLQRRPICPGPISSRSRWSRARASTSTTRAPARWWARWRTSASRPRAWCNCRSRRETRWPGWRWPCSRSAGWR